MRDEEIGQMKLCLQVFQQIDDLGLDRDVEGGDGFVGHDEAGPEHERAGDADALSLPAGKFVRVTIDEVRIQPADPHHLLHGALDRLAAAEAEVAQRLADDRADRHPRIQGAIRVLENHLHPLPHSPQFFPVQRGEFAALDEDRAGGGREQLDDHAAERRFAGARLTDQAEGFARLDLEADPIDSVNHLAAEKAGPHREVLDHVLDADQHLPAGGGDGLRGRLSRRLHL